MHAGEIDGRYVDATLDLGPAGDAIPSPSALAVTISRLDGKPMTADDLALAGSEWPICLDATGLIPSIGFNAPAASAGRSYKITLTVTKTVQGRLWIRDVLMSVMPVMG